MDQTRRRDVIPEAIALTDFVEWAFGPDGFPWLGIVAYGDFSHHGWYRQQGIIFGRILEVESKASHRVSQTTGNDSVALFRVMDDMDPGVWDKFYQKNEFLQACPVESLLQPVNTM
jgi:hypothetical protein